jgi:hypothetical protein
METLMTGGGLGFLFGLSVGGGTDNAAADSAMAGDLARMKAELKGKLHTAQVQEALKVAATELHSEMIEELRDVGKGRVSALRLADPDNQDGRNARLAERLKRAAYRISGGQIRLDDTTLDNVRKARTLK